MTILELTILGLAVARIARLIVFDSLLDAPRETFLRRWPAPDTIFGDTEVTDGRLSTGREVIRVEQGWIALQPYKWAELVTCYWCNSFWVGIIVWVLYKQYPGVIVTLLVPFALSQIAGFLNDR